MKTGDLVRWTHPDDEGVGIVLKVVSLPSEHGTGEVEIYWTMSGVGHHRGMYPAQHRYMEWISESR